MEILDKANIISEMAGHIQDNNKYDEYFEWWTFNDIGIPLAVATTNLLCTPTQQGWGYINETYENLCKELEINPDDDYDSLEDILDDYIRLDDDEEDDG